ncbi:MAG TPA: hypothetical protein VFA17_05850 [Thermoplasmata archaeon]|nr:hypothetical protein [Thermoplasmata archaeon]
MRQSIAISISVLVLIVVVAGVMYAVYGNQGGFTGVPRLLPGDFAQGNTGSIVNTILWGLLIVILFAILGFAVYRMRGLTD